MGDMHTGDPGMGKRGPQDPGGKVAARKKALATSFTLTLEDLERLFRYAEKRQRKRPSDFVSEERLNQGPPVTAAQAKCERFIRFAKELEIMK